jgi:hypothetical protein
VSIPILSGPIALLIKVSILKATYRVTGGSGAVVDHDGREASSVEVASTRAVNCTTPIVAVGKFSDERTIAVAAEARRGQFKRRSKCTWYGFGIPCK